MKVNSTALVFLGAAAVGAYLLWMQRKDRQMAEALLNRSTGLPLPEPSVKTPPIIDWRGLSFGKDSALTPAEQEELKRVLAGVGVKA